jgi:hypothetical protein
MQLFELLQIRILPCAGYQLTLIHVGSSNGSSGGNHKPGGDVVSFETNCRERISMFLRCTFAVLPPRILATRGVVSTLLAM